LEEIVRYTLIFLIFTITLFATNGEMVFKSYCWGCHHQSATAFGPSFEEIATKRSREEIRAHWLVTRGGTNRFLDIREIVSQN